MTQDELKALEGAAEKATAGTWDCDSVGNEGAYGAGPECRHGFKSWAIMDENGQVLFDTLNSETALVEEEYDEDGTQAWDSVGLRNLSFVELANPSAVLSLLADLRSAQEERDQERAKGWRDAVSCVQYCAANWYQDCRSESERDALIKASADLVEELVDGAPEQMKVEWLTAKDWQAKLRKVEKERDRMAKALERIAIATPNNTNSATASRMASWTQSVARAALHLEGAK